MPFDLIVRSLMLGTGAIQGEGRKLTWTRACAEWQFHTREVQHLAGLRGRVPGLGEGAH